MNKFIKVFAVSIIFLFLAANTGQDITVSRGIQWISAQQSLEGH